MATPGVQNLDHILWNDEGKLPGLERDRLGAIQDRFRPKRAVVSQDQLYIPAPPQRAKQLEAIDGREISRFPAQPVIVEIGDRRVGDGGGPITVDKPLAPPPYPPPP